MSQNTLRPEFAYEQTTLDNGLAVIVRSDHRLPIVAQNLWYHVGSKDERPGQRGFAHLFEHLMFEGSTHYPGDFFEPLQKRGANVNGSTSTDRTNYIIDVPRAHLELALAMESDRMAHLLPAIGEKSLRLQKSVVTNEYRQNYANRPYGRAFEILAEALYPWNHPHRWLTIGAMDQVEAATLAQVEAFHRRYYVPANASLCLVGAIDVEAGFELADRYFGSIAGGLPAIPPEVPDVALDADRRLTFRDHVELERVDLTWPTVPRFEPDEPALALAADLLARGRSSRLYRRLVVETEWAQNVSAQAASLELDGTLSVVVTLRPGAETDRVIEVVDRELEALASDVEPAELRRVQAQRRASTLRALQSNGGFGGVADRLNAFNIYTGDPGRLISDIERFDRVRPEDVADAVRRFLSRSGGSKRVELRITPNARRGQVEIDRAQVPKPGPAAVYRAPLPQRFELDNGAALWVFPRTDPPIVSAALAVPAGAGAHNANLGGLAAITSAMLDEGTASRSAEQLADDAESIATHLWSQAGWDGSYVGFDALSEHLEASLDLAVDIARHPSFPEAEWRRIRGQVLAALTSRRQRAEALAINHLLAALYPPNHPYRVPSDGRRETVEPLERTDAQAFHRRFYQPAGSAWIVAGDVDPERIAALWNDRLADWTGTAPAPERPGPAQEPRGRRLILVDRPGAPQAVLRVGQVGLSRSDDDYWDFYVLNHLFGGQFRSRLNVRLRGEKGVTYGARSQFEARRGAGPWVVSTSVQTDRAAEALEEIALEVEALGTDRPPTAAELEDARRSLLDGFPRRFETASDLISRYLGLFLHQRPIDEWRTAPERIAGVGLERLADVAARRLKAEALVAVVVADASEVRRSLEALDWAELEHVADGQGV